MELEPLLERTARAGFSQVELSAEDLRHYLETYPTLWLDRRLRDQGFVGLGVYGLEPIPPCTTSPTFSPRPNVDQLTLHAQFLSLCTRVDALGGGTLTLQAGPWPELRGDPQATLACAARRLRELSQLCAPFDVQIALLAPGGAESGMQTLLLGQRACRQAAPHKVTLAVNLHALGEKDWAEQSVNELNTEQVAQILLSPPSGSGGAQPGIEMQLPAAAKEICRRLARQGFAGPYSLALPDPLFQSEQELEQARKRVVEWLESL
jgi:hypothetical protein